MKNKEGGIIKRSGKIERSNSLPKKEVGFTHHHRKDRSMTPEALQTRRRKISQKTEEGEDVTDLSKSKNHGPLAALKGEGNLNPTLLSPTLREIVLKREMSYGHALGRGSSGTNPPRT